MSGPKPDSVNKPSSCLKASENEEIFAMVGRRSATLATSVAQLYIAPPESRNRWRKKVTGVICFVKDNTKRSYFLRMYSLATRSLEWEQELYNQFKYKATRPHFHTFACDTYNAGLNFANVNEARNFVNELDNKLNAKEKRRQERRKENTSRHNKQPPPPPAVGGNVEMGKRHSMQSNENAGNITHSPSQTSISSVDGSTTSLNRRKSKERKESKSSASNNKKGGKRRITKDDIGKPENFQHVGHIGWDPQAGFDVNNVDMDDNWKKLFSAVGVTDVGMQTKETLDFIYDFVEKRGGIENVTREIEMESAGGPPAPLEILARGPLALKAYNKALTEGKACIKRVPIMLIGQDRAGKTSLKKSLKGETFIKGEESTDGIEKDPSYFKVSTEVWKTGEKNKETESELQMSFECFAAAQLICGSLREEKSTSLDVEESTVAFRLPEETSTNSSEPSVADLNLAFEISEKPSTSGADFVTKETTRDTELSPPVHFKEKSDTRLFVPKIPEDIAALVEKWLQNGENVEDVYSVLWDFGGESVYYATHPIFLTEKAIYILVSDLSRNPYEQAKPPVMKGMYTNHVDTSCSKTNLDYLDFWMSSVYSLVSPDVICQDTSVHVPVTSPRRLPPVFLVCTHADEPYRCSANTRDLALEVYGFLRTKTYREHLFKDVFVVDNTKSGSENECPEVMRLRNEVLAVAKELPQMKEAIPLKWLQYEKALQIRKERDKWIPLDEARQIASDDCRIDVDEEFSTLLNFLHDQRIVIHFSGGSPELEKMVILDPQWLIDVFKKVITVQRYEHTEEKVEELWRKLEEEGILDEILLNHAWSSLFDSQETCKSLTAIMERLSVLCPWPSSDSSKQYLVPSMLMSPPTDEFLELLASVKIPSLFVKFESGRVPPGLFSRLIVLFFQWCNEEWNSQMNPQLFHNFAMFHIRPEQGSSVIFLCHSSSIEIIVHNGNDDLETMACFSHGDRDVTYSRVIHFHLGLMLECMRKEFSWLKNMKYEMCVCCPVCSRPDSVKCHDHDVRGCECLHFLSESELRNIKYCLKRLGIRGDRRIPVEQFAPWFAFPDEHEIRTSPNQQATLRLDKSSSSAKKGETLALALPDGVMQSIHCQTSDPKEIVVQLQESLQLGSGFLENPEPKTKQWIRCLAIEAKAENRTDMVEYLRQIAPAGTAGPLLNEDLDVRRIPFPQRKDLTFSLSGGDEWKLLAERLGLSQIDIRFLDKRVPNPCDVVLGHVGNHRFLSVGELYDMLVDCELPAIADLM